jgi:hypothetical protein
MIYTPPFEGRVVDSLEQACSNFNVVRATSSRFGLQAGNVKFNTHNE